MDTPVRFRFAEREDTPLVLEFIIELARYEKLEDQVVADVETLERELFDEGGAQVLIAEADGQPVAASAAEALIDEVTHDGATPHELERVAARLAARGWPLASDRREN